MRLWTIGFLSVVQISWAAASPSPSPSPMEQATPVNEVTEWIQQGDALFSNRTEDSGAMDAIVYYEKAVQKNPESAEAYWKSSRAAHWIADKGQEKKNRIAWFEKGIAYAKKAIETEPRSVEAHFWLGANYGSYGELKGVLKSLALVGPIRKEMETVVRLDDNYQGGAGYRVLGVVDYKVPSFAGGSKKRALENLNKAVGLDAGNAFNQYYMAEYYEAVGDDKNAALHLDALDQCVATLDVDAPDLKSIQAKGRALRKKIR